MPTPYDQFNVALAGVPSDDERQRQVADRLRGQQGLGAYFQTLGDPMTAKAGAGMLENAVQQTSALQRTRLEEERQAMIKRENAMDRDLDRELADIKAATKSLADYQKPTATEQKEDREAMLALQMITDLEASFEDEFAVVKMGAPGNFLQMATELDEIPVPGARQLSNWAVNKLGADKETMARSNQWWKDMNIKYNFPERYKLFGATLTSSEKSSWDKVAAGESMDPKTVRMLLAKVKAGMVQKARYGADVRRAAGFSPQYVNTVYGEHAQPLSEEAAAELKRRNQTIPTYDDIGYPSAEETGPGEITAEMEIEVPTWGAEQQAELDALRSKYPNR